MTGLKVGYARVSTVGQDLAAQRDGLVALGVEAGRRSSGRAGARARVQDSAAARCTLVIGDT